MLIWQALLAIVKCKKLGPHVHNGSMLISIMVANLKEVHTTGSSSIKDLMVAVSVAGVEDGHGAWELEGTYLK